MLLGRLEALDVSVRVHVKHRPGKRQACSLTRYIEHPFNVFAHHMGRCVHCNDGVWASWSNSPRYDSPGRPAAPTLAHIGQHWQIFICRRFTIAWQQHWRQVFSCGTSQQSYKKKHLPTFDNDFCKPLAGAEQNHGLCWLHECFVFAGPQLKSLPGHPRGVSMWHILIESAGSLREVSFSWPGLH